MVDADKYRLVSQLRERMIRIAPLEDEVDFYVRDDTLLQFLKARDWSVDEAEKQLKETVEWRRTTNPLNIDCRWCHEMPGYHCVRQIGLDKQDRPVIYACFAQAGCNHSTVEDTIVHMTHLIENAKRTMSGSVSTWVFVMDCTGMTLPACNPRLGYGVSNALATFYPERLGLVICINHNPIFHGVWNAFKVFLHPNTVSKMQLIRKKAKYHEAFRRYFNDELAAWLIEEVQLNKQRPLSATQKEFWKTPAPQSTIKAGAKLEPVHDPRGSPSYVRQFIDTFLSEVRKEQDGVTRIHQPHPNIVDVLRGTIRQVDRTSTSGVTSANGEVFADVTSGADDNSDDENDSSSPCPISMDQISEEYRLPADVIEQHKMAAAVSSAK